MTHFQSQFYHLRLMGQEDNDVPSIPRDDFGGNFQALLGPVFMEVSLN